MPSPFVPADSANLDACEQIVAMADQTFGQVDVQVNTVAITDRGSIWDTSPELWDRIMVVNLRAPFFLTQGILEIMKREGVEGSIVNITRISAYGGDAHLTPYASLCRFQARIGNVDQEYCLFGDAPPNPCECTQSRLDEYAE